MPPTMGLDNVNGAELAQPYYWNIAPNRDATFTPTLMTKRGVNLGTSSGTWSPPMPGLRLDWMPGISCATAVAGVWPTGTRGLKSTLSSGGRRRAWP
jgi:hypothetical protein